MACQLLRPLLGHMDFHLSLLTTWLGHLMAAQSVEPLEFPLLALLVSGGHTELVYVSEAGDYKIVGETRDDAVGEAYDKVGRVMGLTYPAGRED